MEECRIFYTLLVRGYMPQFTLTEAQNFITTSAGLETADNTTLNSYLEEYKYVDGNNISRYRPYIVMAKLLYLSPANNIKIGDGITLEGNRDVALRLLKEQQRNDILYNYAIPDDSPISATHCIRQLLTSITDLESAKKGQTPHPMSIVTGMLFP